MMYTWVGIKGNNVVDIYYDKTGVKRIKKVEYQPIVGLLSKDTNTKWKDYYGNSISEVKFDNIRKFRDFCQENEETLDIYGNISPAYQYISETYKEIDVHLNIIKSCFIDIEVHSEDGFPHPHFAAWPITSISIKDNKTNKFYVASTKPYDKFKTELGLNPKNINFKNCRSEEEILHWLIKLLKMLKPDIMCGWNSDGFDFPYIINRFDYLFDEDEKKELSPIGDVSTSTVDGKDFYNKIGGIILLDYLKLYKKYVLKPRPSYSLDYISEVEINEKKIDYSEYDNLTNLWNKNPQKYIDYNIYDVELIDLLDKKLGLINLAATIAYKSKCNIHDVTGTIRQWDTIVYNYLKNKNIMIPPLKVKDFTPFAGAYVKEPVTKMYKWIVSYDLNSLYPHIQQQWNISPECLVPGIHEEVSLTEISDDILNQKIKPKEGYILAGNGQYFRKDITGFFPKLLREFYDMRDDIKNNHMMVEKQKLVDIKEEMKKRGLK